MNELERKAIELYLERAREKGDQVCAACGTINPGARCCENMDLLSLTAGNLIYFYLNYDHSGWLGKIVRCGSCMFGVTHRLPFGCVLGMAGPTCDCERGRQLLAEMHYDNLREVSYAGRK